jgi:hypothetical protein
LAWQPSYSHPSLKRLGIGRAQAWLALLLSSGLNNSGIGFIDHSKTNVAEKYYFYYFDHESWLHSVFCYRRISLVFFRRRIFVAGWCAMNFWLVSRLWLSAHLFLVRWPWRWWKVLPMGWVVCDIRLSFVFFEAPDSWYGWNEVGYFCRSGILNFGGNRLTVRWHWPWLLLYYLV